MKYSKRDQVVTAILTGVLLQGCASHFSQYPVSHQKCNPSLYKDNLLLSSFLGDIDLDTEPQLVQESLNTGVEVIVKREGHRTRLCKQLDSGKVTQRPFD